MRKTQKKKAKTPAKYVFHTDKWKEGEGRMEKYIKYRLSDFFLFTGQNKYLVLP